MQLPDHHVIRDREVKLGSPVLGAVFGVLVVIEGVTHSIFSASNVIGQSAEHLGCAQITVSAPITGPAGITLHYVQIAVVGMHPITGTHGRGYRSHDHIVILLEDFSTEEG